MEDLEALHAFNASTRKKKSMFHVSSKKRDNIRDTLLELQTRNRWLEEERLRLIHLHRQTANELIKSQGIALALSQQSNSDGKWKTVKKQFDMQINQTTIPFEMTHPIETLASLNGLGIEFFEEEQAVYVFLTLSG